jgi:hypothetical protein
MSSYPVFVDEFTMFGDGTEAHPLTAGALIDPTNPFSSNFISADSTGVNISAAETGSTVFVQSNGDITITTLAAGSAIRLQSAAGATDIITVGAIGAALALSFFNSPLAVKQTVTGAKAGNAALTSLLQKLAAIGLITDSTT